MYSSKYFFSLTKTEKYKSFKISSEIFYNLDLFKTYPSGSELILGHVPFWYF